MSECPASMAGSRPSNCELRCSRRGTHVAMVSDGFNWSIWFWTGLQLETWLAGWYLRTLAVLSLLVMVMKMDSEHRGAAAG